MMPAYDYCHCDCVYLFKCLCTEEIRDVVNCLAQKHNLMDKTGAKRKVSCLVLQVAAAGPLFAVRLELAREVESVREVEEGQL